VEEVDVLVVGAGPAGSNAAYHLSQRGYDVLVIEEHDRIGYPVQCAGLVSQRVLDLAGSDRFVRRPIHGASVFGPSLGSVEFTAAEPRAHVIDRAGLDIYLADRAARAGARYSSSTRFDRALGPTNGRTHIELSCFDGEPREIAARLVLGADGVTSAVARAYGLRRPVEILPAFEAEFATSPGDPDRVEVYLGRDFAPGLFGWWIPDGAGGARVGIAADADGTSARVRFDRLLDHLERRFGRRLNNPTAYLVSGIPIGHVPRTHADRVLLIGDAAGQVKPLSGGGIFTGMRCAEIAAEVADGALRQDDLSSRALSEYDRRWWGELGEEFDRALYLRRLFVRLSDAECDRLIEVLKESDLLGTIVAFGDIDFPTHVARRLLAQSPSLLRLLPKALGAWLAPGDRFAPALDPVRRK
jgi:geranylgeranyl reductase family protein